MHRRQIIAAIAAYLGAAMLTDAVAAITPDNPGGGAIQFTLDSGVNVHTISPWIYGSNSTNIINRTFDRSGGNRTTGYNWENNASNAGSDWYHHSDYGMANDNPNAPPGFAVRDMIEDAHAAGRAALITVPMAGYVAADGNGTVDETEIAPSPRWKQVLPKKTDHYPGAVLSLNPDKTDGYVFTDEFVNWAEDFKDPDQQLWYSLDNEPGLWGEELPGGWQSGDEPRPWENPPYPGFPASSGGRTHPTIHPYRPSFQGMRDKSIDHSLAIKSVNLDALVFGGVGYGWNEFTTMENAPDKDDHFLPAHSPDEPSGEMHYNEYLLQQTRAAELANAEILQGRKLMDVLDLHWYPEARSGTDPDTNPGIRITDNNNSAAVVAARVQAPRSLWDPSYTEVSWVSKWGTWTGDAGTMGPVKLLPRVQRDIDDFNPGVKIAITEYNYGGGNHISGAIAQADVLGIFGREGVFAASWWELDSGSSFVNGAFNMFRNFDGAGGKFGDTSIDADTTNIAQSAIYASVDEGDPNRMVVVAINRTASATTTGISVTHDRIFDRAEVYRLTSASATPQAAADIELDLVNAFQYTMPAWSVTTLVLISDGLPGDYNRDGEVDGLDYAVWRNSLGAGGNTAADGNEDDIVDDDDFALWKEHYGLTESTGAGGLAVVPEPSALALLALTLLIACGLAPRRAR